MKLIIQRVNSASISIEHQLERKINRGYLVYLGITHTDTSYTADKMVDKLLKIRLFPSKGKPMNENIETVDGDILIVSQFTLYADTQKGNRPNFIKAAKPQQAELLYNYFVKKLELNYGKPIKTGVFGANMKVISENDGPVTVTLEAK